MMLSNGHYKVAVPTFYVGQEHMDMLLFDYNAKSLISDCLTASGTFSRTAR